MPVRAVRAGAPPTVREARQHPTPFIFNPFHFFLRMAKSNTPPQKDAPTAVPGESAALMIGEHAATPTAAFIEEQESSVLRVTFALKDDPGLAQDLPTLCNLAEMSPYQLERAFHHYRGLTLQAFAREMWDERLRSMRRVAAREWLIAAI